MSLNPADITVDQLRNGEIVASDLLHAAAATPADRRTAIASPGAPLSVFGRKMVGHDA